MDVYETRKKRFLELLATRYKGQVSVFCRATGAHLISKAEVTVLPDGSSQWDGVIVERDP